MIVTCSTNIEEMSALPLCQGTFSSGFETSNITSVGQCKSHSVPAPIVAGIILGVVFAVILLTGAVIFALLRRRRYRQTSEIGGLEVCPDTLPTVELNRCELEGPEKCAASWAKVIPPPMQQKLPIETRVVELHAQDIAIAELQSPVVELRAQDIAIAELQSPVPRTFPEMPDSTTRASAVDPFGFRGNENKNLGTASSSSGLNNIQRQSVSLSPHRSHPDPRPVPYPETEVQPPYSGIVTRFPIHQGDRTINGVMTCKHSSSFSGPQQRVADDGYQRNTSMASPDFISAHSHVNDPLSNLRPHFQSLRRNNSILQSASAILATHSRQTPYGQSPVSPLQSSPLRDIRHSISKSPMFDILSQLPDTPPSSARLLGTFGPHYNIYDEVSSMGIPLLPTGSSGSFIEPALGSDSWEVAESPRTMPTLVSNSTVPINQFDTDYAEFQ